MIVKQTNPTYKIELEPDIDSLQKYNPNHKMKYKRKLIRGHGMGKKK